MTADGVATDGLPGDPRPPTPPPIEYVLEYYGPDVLAGLLDKGGSCWWCADPHPVGQRAGACPLRIVPADELTERRRRHREILS